MPDGRSKAWRGRPAGRANATTPHAGGPGRYRQGSSDLAGCISGRRMTEEPGSTSIARRVCRRGSWTAVMEEIRKAYEEFLKRKFKILN